MAFLHKTLCNIVAVAGSYRVGQGQGAIGVMSCVGSHEIFNCLWQCPFQIVR